MRLCEAEGGEGLCGSIPSDAPASTDAPSLEGEGNSGVDRTGAREACEAGLVQPPSPSRELRTNSASGAEEPLPLPATDTPWDWHGHGPPCLLTGQDVSLQGTQIWALA